MHVVHLIARLNDGGPARAIHALVDALVASGSSCRITVLAGACGADERDLTPQLRAGGITVTLIPALMRPVSPWGDLRAFLAIRRQLRHLAPDLVHTHTAKAGALGRLACRSLGIPCLHTYHGHVLQGYFSPGVSQLVAMAERLLAGDAHHHALTASQHRDLHLHARIGRRARWHVAALPIPMVQPREALWQRGLRPGVPVIGFLGRLTAIKDGMLWLEMLAQAQAQSQAQSQAQVEHRTAVQGLICGDGDQRPALEARSRELGVTVLFTGFVPAGEALAAMAVLVMTSRNEGLPFAAVEAAGAGVLVVAPRVGGLRDWIDRGGAVGAPRTAPGLARAVVALLADPVRSARQRARAQALAGGLAPGHIGAGYERIYRSIVHPA